MHNESRPDPGFQAVQQAFARQIRQPGREPMPDGVAPARMAIYSELFFNNVESFLADSFPVLHQVLPPGHWHGMVRDFFARHACATPLFTRLGEEFLHYLQQERGSVAGDPPFLAELAHYEWVELALTLSDAEPLPVPDLAGDDLLTARLALSPLAWPLHYRFPVHRIGADAEAGDLAKAPAQLLVYRDEEERVVFLEIDDLTHVLLSTLQTVGAAPVGELLETLAALSGCPSQADLIGKGLKLFESMIARGVIGNASTQRQAGTPAGHITSLDAEPKRDPLSGAVS